MSRKIFSSILLTAVVSIITTCVIVIWVLYSNYIGDIEKQLKNEAVLVQNAIEYSDENYLDKTGNKSNNRITLVAPNGKVLYDNYAKEAELDNHITRPEIESALNTGDGKAIRLSDTLGMQTMYYAVKIDNGNVLRMAVTTDSVFGVINDALIWIIVIIVALFLLTVLIAKTLTKSIVTPLNTLNLDAPLKNDTYPELSTLLVRMDKQNKQIKEQVELVCKKQKELEYITENMTEGLVIFSSDKTIILENESAKKLFGERYQHDNYLALSRDLDYIKAVESSFLGSSAFAKIVADERVYQISCTPINRDGGSFGAVMFIVDITEREEVERIRQEFTANVSHELKTPLTSIMGRAEIMVNGIAKPEDMLLFAGQIYEESKRIKSLIEDIIHLSNLDENSLKNEFKDINLNQVCKEIINSLKEVAETKNIYLEYIGTPVHIMGIEPSIKEIVYNLCHNAINYNRAGGEVKVSLASTNDKAVIVVEDNGIGIPIEHQSRIFERFYCVDKSRSKKSGGTGLGLSIVKHSVKLHNGSIRLESEPNVGTKIIVEI